jgi:hypothetical protein
MGAGKFIPEATRTGAVTSKGLTQYDRCCCHPRAWGLKKGLRRARRRVGLAIIRRELQEA